MQAPCVETKRSLPESAAVRLGLRLEGFDRAHGVSSVERSAEVLRPRGAHDEPSEGHSPACGGVRGQAGAVRLSPLSRRAGLTTQPDTLPAIEDRKEELRGLTWNWNVGFSTREE